jgi:hypothetical protein
MKFTKKQPCNNCPYRKDAPLAHWAVEEFIQVLDKEESTLGGCFGCHKNDDNVCVGFLMDQDKRNFPSIVLRMELIKQNINRKYLDSLNCKSKMFKSIKEMCLANFPEIII